MPRPSKRAAARPRASRSTRIGAVVATVAASAGLAAAAAPAAAQDTATPLLKPGSHGRTVTELQNLLHAGRGGRFGRGTERAVRRYQSRKGLTVDGIVGTQTWDALLGIAAPAATTSTATSSTGAGGYTIPSGIVQCESGGNYSAVNPSTGAGGAYQILPSTWAAYGGQGLPQDASPAEQGQIASRIMATQGPSAWTC
ncbi:MAG: transglycosylase family protein [Solirubrobacteraceae bacterium]